MEGVEDEKLIPFLAISMNPLKQQKEGVAIEMPKAGS